MNANNIIRRVADIYGVPVEAVLSPCRRRDLADCRTVICFVLVQRCGLTKVQTARIIGRKHPNVIYHVAKGWDWLDDPRLNRQGHEAIKTMLTKKPP